jgi:hydroxyacylglutathione hydrolase
VIEVVTIETPELGDRSYLVTDGTAALVVDPQRDIDRVLTLADERWLRITHVAETHVHNDYVTGGLALARATGAAYVMSAPEDVAFAAERIGVSDGDRLAVGTFDVHVVRTPGHTPHHVSYVVGHGDGIPVAAFTGGSLLFGSAGRTDLIDPSSTEELTRAQWRSIRRLGRLPDTVTVHPTHGFGSFCSATPGRPRPSSTVGEERDVNPGMVLDEDEFVRAIMSGFTTYPSYYRHMARLNRAGPSAAPVRLPVEVGPAELRARQAWGEWIVDVRPRRRFAAAHVRGSINLESGALFATYLGWTLPWGSQVTLVGDDVEQIARAPRDLARIGFDRVGGHAVGGPVRYGQGHEVRSFRVARFADLARAYAGSDAPLVLDVRRPDEWRDGHLPGALHIPLYELVARAPEVPADTEVWIHCAGGFRASIAGSLLDTGNRTIVVVDDDWSTAPAAGLRVVVG